MRCSRIVLVDPSEEHQISVQRTRSRRERVHRVILACRFARTEALSNVVNHLRPAGDRAITTAWSVDGSEVHFWEAQRLRTVRADDVATSGEVATATAPPSPPRRLLQRGSQGGSAVCTHTDNKLKYILLERRYGDKGQRLTPAGRAIGLTVPIDALDDPCTPSLGKTARMMS